MRTFRRREALASFLYYILALALYAAFGGLRRPHGPALLFLLLPLAYHLLLAYRLARRGLRWGGVPGLILTGLNTGMIVTALWLLGAGGDLRPWFAFAVLWLLSGTYLGRVLAYRSLEEAARFPRAWEVLGRLPFSRIALARIPVLPLEPAPRPSAPKAAPPARRRRKGRRRRRR